MGGLKSKNHYEAIRTAQILHNQARLASMGSRKTISELRSMKKSHVRKYQKVDYGSTPQRRSARLNRLIDDSIATSDHIRFRRSNRLRGTHGEPISPHKGKLGLFGKSEEMPSSEREEKRPEVLDRPCASETRISVYPSVSRRKTLKGEQDCKQQCGNLEMDQRSIGMTDCSSNGVVCQAFLKATKAQKCSNHHETKSDYESIRTARILENQARLASLGLHKTISDLRLASPVNTYVKKYQKVDYECTPRRCSARLKGTTADSITSDQYIPLQCSNRLRGTSSEPISPRKEKVKLFGKSEEKLHSEGDEKTSANRPLVRLAVGTNMKLELSPDVLGRRCSSKSRGTVYHPVFGICCHFCRQKTLCVEEDCKRCGDLDMDQPCLGKTDCSVCHSSNGVLCRACLKVRYGEEMEVVRRNKQWMCPHCIEDKGIKPYWICNSSLCLRKRKKVPTGVAIFKAREMGYKSVAHLLMDELQRTL
ncbi:hypothetical protein CsSME_00054170 [Camellia sinensis var. sinensis]